MAPVRCFTRNDFLREYEFPHQPARDFERDGQPAEYASCHPMQWNELAVAIDFEKDTQEMKKDDERTRISCDSALSPDQKLLAISTSYNRILIYDVVSKERRAVLEGGGGIRFRPLCGEDESGYTLISSISYDRSRGALPKNQLIIWDLDQNGRLLDQEEPIDAPAYATKAIEAILPDLISEHEWTNDFVQASDLHAQVTKALSAVAADHRRRHQTVLDDAKMGNFGSVHFSKDGRLMLCHRKNESTQHGMRTPELLPQVVVYDVEAGKALHHLSGHTDAVMWSAISPDMQSVASVSWDGTLRMYSLSTGELAWVTEDSGSQSWSGDFTPDSKHIIWSSASGRTIQVLAVADGKKVSTFGEKFNDWCRLLRWHPSGQQVAFCVGKHAYVWQPFEGEQGTIVQHFELDSANNSSSMEAVGSVLWMDEGRLLALEISDGTKVVYNMETNAKEVFARPKGLPGFYISSGFYGLLKNEPKDENEGAFYLSVDGDGKLRYWRTSFAARASWWEKGQDTKEDASASKKTFPETGKYVKITKVPSKSAEHKDEDRSSWADKGGELWTAE